MSNVIKNKGKHKILGKDKVYSEKIRLEVKGEIEDFVSEEESKFVSGRWQLVILSFSRQEMSLGKLIELWVDAKTLQVSYFTILQTFKESVRVLLKKKHADDKKWI